MASENSPSVCLVLLIGLPGVGKTTFCNKLSAFLSENNTISKLDYGVLHICYDELLPLSKQKEMALTAKKEEALSDVERSHENFKTFRKNIVSLTDQIICNLKQKSKLIETDEFTKFMKSQYDKVCLNDNVIILIDDNNYYQSMRYEYFQIARKATIGFCEIYLQPETLETVFHYNNKRSKDEKIPEDVISKMNDKIEPPNPFQNSWEKFSFTFSVHSNETDKSMYNLEVCLDALKASLQNPVEPLQETPPDKTPEFKADSRKICSTNVYHISDKILR